MRLRGLTVLAQVIWPGFRLRPPWVVPLHCSDIQPKPYIFPGKMEPGEVQRLPQEHTAASQEMCGKMRAQMQLTRHFPSLVLSFLICKMGQGVGQT